MPCPLPRWTRTGARVGDFPVGAAFPDVMAGRRPRLHFRGLLRLHSRYGLQGCSATQGGLCHKASARSGPLPVQAACQLPDLPTTIWVGLPPTGDLRRWGAHNIPALNANLLYFHIHSRLMTALSTAPLCFQQHIRLVRAKKNSFVQACRRICPSCPVEPISMCALVLPVLNPESGILNPALPPFFSRTFPL